MNPETLLMLAGLPRQQAALYRALVEHGPGTIADIERWSGVHRPTIYKHLPALKARGLVTERTLGKRVQFVPSSPDMILTEIDAVKAGIDDSLADLRSSYERKGSRPRVQYFEGKPGVQRVIQDLLTTLKRGEVYYRYGSRKTETDGKKFQPTNFSLERDKKQLERFVITSSERARHYKNDWGRMVKTVPEQVLFDDNVQVMIYGDKVSIIDYGSETGIIIEHKQLASFQQKLFRLLFQRL